MTERERAAVAEEIAAALERNGSAHSCGCDASSGPDDVPETRWSGLAGRLDLCLERPDASEADTLAFLEAARSIAARSVCVPPRWTALAVRAMQGRPSKVASVVGSPSGASLTPAKCSETACLLRLGVDEVWMVADIGGLRSGDLDAAYVDIKAVSDLAACRGVPVSVVLELPQLRGRQKIEACAVAKLAGAAAAVSANGYGESAARTADIEIMRQTVGGDLDIVAAGGIRTAAEARRMIDAGATRVAAAGVLSLAGSDAA